MNDLKFSHCQWLKNVRFAGVALRANVAPLFLLLLILPMVEQTPVLRATETPATRNSFLGAKAGDEITVAGLKLCWCPPGRFLMGSPRREPERRPGEDQVEVTLTKGFWMAKYEATQGQWKRVVGKLPGPLTAELPEGDDFPVGNVNFAETETFCQKLTELAHQSGELPKDWEFRLPTEAQWEYACRAGTTTAYSFGDDPAAIGDYAWYYDNSSEKYQKIGQKKPNPWGLHDMHGNVAEWVLDQHTKGFYAESAGKMTKDALKIPLVEYPRVVRGGSWQDDPALLRSAARLGSNEDWKEQDPQIPQSIWYFTDALHVGFRIVRPLTAPSKEEDAAKWDKSEPPQIDKKKTE